MDTARRAELIENMTENLPTLRKKMGLSQEELAGLLGVSRSTIVVIEGRRRKLTWDTFLALILILSSNKNTNLLLTVFDIYPDELREYLKSSGRQ